MSDGAQRIGERLAALAKISDEPNQLTRAYGSPAMRLANALVSDWMRDAGMVARGDEIGNVIGRYEGVRAGAKIFLLGSHLDTVRNAGAFDGPLGVILAIECVKQLHASGVRLPFAIEVIGFCDEEGVRFQNTYLGSRALAGTLTDADLQRTDENGISLADAIRNFGGQPENLLGAKRNPSQLLGYAEVHIEQGPVLEQKNLSVGVVLAISGQSRIKVRFTGKAGHAGTTPMDLRRDALCAAAELISTVEAHTRSVAGLVATVGQIQVAPGASNVIPGEAHLTLDIRHQVDSVRLEACGHLQTKAEEIGRQRGIFVSWEIVHQTNSVPCDPELTFLLKRAAQKHQPEIMELSSGAGHDAAVMGKITPAVMLFVQCRDGLSHHPDESAKAEDIAVALNVMNDFLQFLAQKHG
ncbi:MAG TPA: allantoate amidohydrolase [Verrucomicrobiae bacterium]|jgi:allantoate deiminase